MVEVEAGYSSGYADFGAFSDDNIFHDDEYTKYKDPRQYNNKFGESGLQPQKTEYRVESQLF